ncbi:MAG: RNA polymerase sigma factor RpoD/SigA [Bacteroidia bacterium]|nr:RNA polymerase sigma factor RpoD/SigA [Bacteroidia bacterium]NNF29991.1 RNA polymerase sigma factor RpoD/SigA [Flavobacteriaceae bacterium]MBT8276029.1 RNA polymerase sigma factor RpoD/SigA [Bacteroidia bacterium]NNJ83195.1 RNA polymerase sigma factor RpoD/SigA [Flavobacteriaceae bacterium]NNK53696.1 RNA polymerase sigma factor RpoD/SigA [Flavobacteriaceae bacterium]
MRQLKISKQVTNRETKSLNNYLQDVSKIDLITAEEEVELARLIKEGDERALDKLVRANLRFVVSVAKQYQNQGLRLPDLINEGNIGLVKAAKRFDETRGFKFISYAVWWIRQSILQAISVQARVVRLPLNKIGLINRIRKTSLHLQQVYERQPTVAEIAKEMDEHVDKIKNAMKESNRSISMDAPFQEGENDNNLYDVVKSSESPVPDNELMRESLEIEIARTLNTLPDREADVLRLNFGLADQPAMTLQEIGDTFDISRERVRQIREKALGHLRSKHKSHILKKYLG